MPIDPSIALSVRPVQFNDPVEQQSRIQAMQLNGMQVAQAQQEQQQQRTLADLYRGNTGQDGKVDSQGMLRGMASAGLGAKIPGYQKQMLDTQKAEADLGKVGIETDAAKFKLQKDRLNASNGMLASLLSKPAVTHEDVIQGIAGIVQRGFASPEEGAAIIKSLPGHPEALRDFLMQKGLEGMDEAKRMELLVPKFEKMDLGGKVQTGTTNQLTGKFTPGQALSKTVTPDAVLSANTSTANTNARIAADNANTDKQIGAADRRQATTNAKPMPASAVKMQKDDLEAIGIASGTQADLSALEKQIDEGKLDFGPVSNLVDAARNMAGKSTEQSRNKASFKSTLEKLRNDSLRLNTGVQTDGDAQRAWNELFANINDMGLVRQRLGEIKRLNARAVQLRKLNIENLRANYGKETLDTSGYENQEAALGPQSATPPDIDALLKKHGGKK